MVEAAAPTPQRRCSERQRLAAILNSSSGKSATQKAVDVECKWMAFTGANSSRKEDKKNQCLSKYTGTDKQKAKEALDDLLPNAAATPSK